MLLSDSLVWGHEALLPLLWVPVLPLIHAWTLIQWPFLSSLGPTCPAAQLAVEMKVLSVCLHTSVSSKGHLDHTSSSSAWVGAGGVREQSRPPWGLGPEDKRYLEAELRELGSLGYRWQLQDPHR